MWCCDLVPVSWCQSSLVVLLDPAWSWPPGVPVVRRACSQVSCALKKKKWIEIYASRRSKSAVKWWCQCWTNLCEHNLSYCCKVMAPVLNQPACSLSCCRKLIAPVLNQPERSLSCCCKMIAPVMNQPACWLSCHCKLMAPVWLDTKTTKQLNQEQMAWKMFHSGCLSNLAGTLQFRMFFTWYGRIICLLFFCFPALIKTVAVSLLQLIETVVYMYILCCRYVHHWM